MNDDLRVLIDRLTSAERDEVLMLLAAAIGRLTILARASRNEPDEIETLRLANDMIHRVAGHARDLTSSVEPLTPSRIEALISLLAILSPEDLRHLAQLRR